MTIYIETFLIQNFLINLCLLKLVSITTKSKGKFFRLCLSSLFGCIVSLVIAYFLTNNIILNIAKILCAIVMIKIAFSVKLKNFIFNFILLFLYTYAFGGAIMSLTSCVYFTNAGIVMSSNVSLEIICLIILVITYLFELVAKHLKYKFKTNNFIYEVTLYLNQNHITINAYLDTGNLLTYNGLPVVILDLKTYLKLTKNNLIKFYLTPSKTIKTNTVNGSENLKLIKLDKMIIHNGKNKKSIKEQYVAVTPNFKADNYSALLSPNVI